MAHLAIILLLASHFVGDFVFQSDKMALNKSRSWGALLQHVSVYTLFLLPWVGWMWGASTGWFAVISCGGWVWANFFAHLLTDAVTSRWTAKLHAAGERHWFFVVIGLDQFIHYATLIGTWAWLAEAA